MDAVILLSGGLDSAVNLAFGVRNFRFRMAITAHYGQMAAEREISAARALAAHYGVPHQTVDLPFMRGPGGGALLGCGTVPEPDPAALDDPAQAAASARRVWVPNRNGLLVNVAAFFAEAMGCTRIVCGFNREEAATFPDNSEEFVAAVNDALRRSTLCGVQVVSFTQRLSKDEIVSLGDTLGVPWELIWSCYRGGEKPCGSCESCRRLARAVASRGRNKGG
ncbi:MAG: 7-cyano-7-deazaguanine synthase QueC [Thermoanaerobacterales bacterium]|nr:7-cyano-7-deazaguanine synthase QueC [Bacillota bacterium]MDI6906347.1 7-cyano-7-deazaguanine synthase QueC [Thermoanaerobacterales bacterium]